MFKKLYILLFCFLFLLTNTDIFGVCKQGRSAHSYAKIPGCECFCHCTCFKHHMPTRGFGGFPADTPSHPKRPQDRIWHEFMKKFLTGREAGPYFSADEDTIKYMVNATHCCGYICLLSEYLNATERLKCRIELARRNNIKLAEKMFKLPAEREEFLRKIDQYNAQTTKAFQILSTIPETIIPIFKELIAECPHNKPCNMIHLYNRGLIALLEGKISESLSDIISFIELVKRNGTEDYLTSELFQTQGEAFLEVGLYHEAIEALNTAIDKDPKNLEAYFQRASAYFEIGDFEKSLKDYMSSKKSESFDSSKFVSNEFIDAFSKAAFNGACDSACDFVPSLCYTVYGLGECLWAFGEHPIDSVKSLARSGYEVAENVIDYLKTVDAKKFDKYADELVRLYHNFDQLSDREKGELIGYTVGKFGVDIFAGSATIKGVAAYKKLKDANRICNFEAMAISDASKANVVSHGLQQCSERSKFFENSKIEWGKQDKHIPGSNNYKISGTQSIWTHNDPEYLLKKYAGTGSPTKGKIGQPGYKEIVDFKENIGIWKNLDGDSLPTTKGTIHYSKSGAHIVPAHPEAKTW